MPYRDRMNRRPTPSVGNMNTGRLKEQNTPFPSVQGSPGLTGPQPPRVGTPQPPVVGSGEFTNAFSPFVGVPTGAYESRGDGPYVGSTGVRGLNTPTVGASVGGQRQSSGNAQGVAKLKSHYPTIKDLMAGIEVRYPHDGTLRNEVFWKKYAAFEESGYGDPYQWWADIMADYSANGSGLAEMRPQGRAAVGAPAITPHLPTPTIPINRGMV